MENDQFIKTLDMLCEVKQRTTEEEINREVLRIRATNDTNLYTYYIKIHKYAEQQSMHICSYKDFNSIHYTTLVSHKIYDNKLINIGYIMADRLKVVKRIISLDIFNSDHSTLSEINKFHLYMVLCALAYLSTPIETFGLDFAVNSAKTDKFFKTRIDSLIKRYAITDDTEFIDISNNLLFHDSNPQYYRLMHKLHSSYKATRHPYTPVPNLFELCSYDRTLEDGYDIKCINKTYLISAIRHYPTIVERENIDIDLAYSCVGACGSSMWEIYKDLLIDFHQHIYEKEIDIEKLHELIMVDEELTPYEHRIAIIFHRGILKYFIRKGRIGHKDEVGSVVLKDVIPDIKEKNIYVYKAR